MQNSFKRILWGAVFALLFVARVSHAATIVSNLTDAVGGQGTVYAPPEPQEYAQEFVTGGQSAPLGQVIADLGGATGSLTASAELVANNAGQPGSTILTSFTVPVISTTYSDLTFTPTSTATLSANTDYWFVLIASGTGSYKWAYTDTNSASVPLYASSHDGVTWNVESNGPFLIEVDSSSAAAAPEPASFILAGLGGLLGLGTVLARRSRAA